MKDLLNFRTSAVTGECTSSGKSSGKSSGTSSGTSGVTRDRRGSPRVRLRCPVILWDPTEGSVLRTNTDNISSDGFYCPSTEPYGVGTRLEALLEVPCDSLPDHDGHPNLVLQCRVQVIRIDMEPRNLAFGIAFQIESFSVPVAQTLEEFAQALYQHG